MPQLGSAVFVGTARNCARYLPLALERWSALARCFSGAHFIVAENDFTDDTKAILADWASSGPNRQVLGLDGLAKDGALRSNILAIARNRLLDEIRGRPELSGAEFLIVMDMDEASLALTQARLRRCIAMPGWDGLFANQLFYYNDVWALRDSRRCPDDWVERVAAAPPGWRRKWAKFRYLTWPGRPIWPFAAPMQVRSAFGGFGIYRMGVALNSRYAGWRDGREICEHVPFNERLTANGARLFLHPGLINMLPLKLFRLARRLGYLQG